LYSADITGDIIARRLIFNYTKSFLYFKEKRKYKPILRIKVRKASKFQIPKTYYGFFKMQKQKLRHFYGHNPKFII